MLSEALPIYSGGLGKVAGDPLQVGKVKLYLLDSKDTADFHAHWGVTRELYGGGPELRLKQEILLGIGGWRLLCALGIKPEVCQLDEGHATNGVHIPTWDSSVPANRPLYDFTARLIFNVEGLNVPLEDGHDLWQS